VHLGLGAAGNTMNIDTERFQRECGAPECERLVKSRKQRAGGLNQIACMQQGPCDGRVLGKETGKQNSNRHEGA